MHLAPRNARNVITDTLVTRRSPPEWLTPEALDARVRERWRVPRGRRGSCTFAFHGPAITVRFVHFGVGLPDELGFSLLDEDRQWWLLTLEIPRGTRLEYKLEVTDSFGTRLTEDPLNWRTASHPFGANSVCEAPGYATPDCAIERHDVPRGAMHDVSLESAALGRRATVSVYLPAGFTAAPKQRYPLVIVHDGPDYLRFAAASTVVDNLVHGGVLPPTIVAFAHPGERLVEYADDARHHVFLTEELLPHLERTLPAGGSPAKRCLVGASFGAVASLSAAAYAPGRVRPPAPAVGIVRRSRRRLLAATGGAVATGEALRPPLPRRSQGGLRTRLRHVRALRVVDL